MAAVLDRPAPTSAAGRDRKVSDFFRIRLREANGQPAIDEVARTAKVVIITEGLGNLKDRNFYMPSAIESAVEAFEGKQFYLDHPSRTEEDDRPERSVRDLAGYFSDCAAGTTEDPDTGEELTACFATLHFAESDPGRLAYEQVKTALEYQQRYPKGKDVYAGISINAGGVSHPGTIRGMQVNVVTKIAEAFSADIVTKPARGGKFLAQARESVVGSGAGIAARVAAYHQQRGRESGRSHQRARMGLREGTMAQQGTITRKRKLTEAQRTRIREALLKRLKAARESNKLDPKLVTALKEADDSALLAMVQDIMQDVGALADALHSGGKPAAPAPAPGGQDEAEGDEDDEGEGEAEGEEEDDEGEGEAEGDEDDEGEGEAEGDEDDEGDENGMPAMGMGMTDEGDEDDEGEGAGGALPMKYTCEGCQRENEVLPPKGYVLTKSAESQRGGRRRPHREARRQSRRLHRESGSAHDILVARLRNQLAAKEERFREAKGRERRLWEENLTLKARDYAHEIERRAGLALREARIPRDILSVNDLIGYHESVWPSQIAMAKRVLSLESRRTPMNHRAGDGRPMRESGQSGKAPDAIEVFDQHYKRGER